MSFSFACVAVVVLGSCVCGEDPETTPFPQASFFACHGRPPGYYADLDTGCKTYHVCDGNSHFTYICPKGTLFQQRTRICDHSYLVSCQDSPSFLEEADHDAGTSLRPPDFDRTTGFFRSDYNQTDQSVTTPTAGIPKFVTTPPSTVQTPTTQKPATESTTVNLNDDNVIDPLQKFLKFRLKDSRSLFFIPEFENNSVSAKPEKELVLPVKKSHDLMTFKNRRESRRHSYSACPAYCDAQFFAPGTCHPCIMIK